MAVDWKNLKKKITDFVMPPIEVENEDGALVSESVAEDASRAQEDAYEERMVANGGTVHYLHKENENTFGALVKNERPRFVVHQAPTLKVQVYVPTDFNQVTAIADDLKNHKACIVNYEQVDLEMQRRVCDFINGSCYVIDGGVKRISNHIVLYVPEGVSVADAISVAEEE